MLEYNSTHRVGGTTSANSNPNAAPSPAAGTPNASTAYMTGQYAFQPYTANIFYMLATYKFQ